MFFLFLTLIFVPIYFSLFRNLFKSTCLNQIIWSFFTFDSFKPIQLYGSNFAPLKIFCYNLSKKWRPDNDAIKRLMYYQDSREFQFYIEIEFYQELLLSPLLTKNPEEADFFYIPIYAFALRKSNPTLVNFSLLVSELRQFGPWYDRKNGADHIFLSGYDLPWIGNDFMKDFLQSKIIYCGVYPVIGSSWMKYEYKRFIVIPFASYYPKYPFEKIDWMSKRKNKIFLAQSIKPGIRQQLLQNVQKMKNNDILIIKRCDQDLAMLARELPNHYMNADFCPCPKGDNPVAKRNFDVAYFGCIPVYLSDNVVLPFAGNLLNYSKFSLHIPESDVSHLAEIIESYSDEEIRNMRKELRKAAKLYLFRPGEPPRIGEGFWSISWMLYIRYLYNLQFDFKYYPPKNGWNQTKYGQA